ncbi:hypothetical protein QFC21_000241 [Naganishia friedmannii]|uniref:Uncharacterized protein n=1 Tax=Naganishia friedmannii TaxID=89922 RepID=A0ACC2WC48_9TREE|nr:hypothetical protein QFC21_000241 [Naganishia friedmannii]
MKDYGYGKLMDDYVFLEDGKRKAEQWGKEIVGLKLGSDRSAEGPGGGGPRQAVNSGKTLALQQALREKGMYADFLPEGMERRRRNQSHFNPKTKHLQISMEFRYPSPVHSERSTVNTDHAIQPASSPPATHIPSYQMQNIPLNNSTNLHRIYATQARKIPSHYPIKKETETTDEQEDLVFAMKVYHPSGLPLSAPKLLHAPSSPQRGSSISSERYYTPLPALTPLDTSVKGTAFVEYPTIDVFLQPHWEELVQTGKVSVHSLNHVAEHGGGDTTHREQTTSARHGVAEQAVKRKNPDDGLEAKEKTIEPTLHDDNAKRPRVEEDAAAETMPPPYHDKTSTLSPTVQAAPEILVPAKTDVITEHGDTGKASGLLSLDYGSDSD